MGMYTDKIVECILMERSYITFIHGKESCNIRTSAKNILLR